MKAPHTYDPRRGFPRAVVELRYDELDAAVSWLERVFGFHQTLRQTERGRLVHVDVELDGAVVMLGTTAPSGPLPDRRAARDDERAIVLVLVDDVDRHFARVTREHGPVTSEPTDKPWGLRTYGARDCEGHVWQFASFLDDVPPERWGAVEVTP